MSVSDLDSKAVLITAAPYGRVYRIRHQGHSCILKQFTDPRMAREIECYAFLSQCGVPTLPVHAQFPNAIILEDLESSATWRCATEDDMQREEVGRAIALWCRVFHGAGSQYLKDNAGRASFLVREIDKLTPRTVLDTGARLGLVSYPVWRLAAKHIEALTAAMRSLPQTFNHNDFYWGNLALSRDEPHPLRAIVFDYHLMGIGLAYSDCRNVVNSLGQTARAAFWETYGPRNLLEEILDAPTSVLYGLLEAASQAQWPSWANSLVEHARKGGLEADIKKAAKTLRRTDP